MALKTVVFKEKEKVKEGFKNGKMWVKYQYLGDDGEHYTLFGNHDLEVPYQLAQKQREFAGKMYTDWFIVPEGKAPIAAKTPTDPVVQKPPGAGVQSILAKLDEIDAGLKEVHRILAGLEERWQKKIDAELPF